MSKKPRTWLHIITGIVVIITYWLTRAVNDLALLPSYNEMPIILSPLATIFMSSLIFGEFIEKKQGNPVIHFIFAQLTVILCVVLAASVQWWLHLTMIFIIFSSFVFWDALMMRDDTLEDQFKAEIAAGNIYINLPTLAAILVSLIYLACANLRGTMEIPLNGEQTKMISLAFPQSISLMHPIDTFVMGLIAFHLLVSAFSYWVVSYGKGGKIITFWKSL